MGTSRANKVMRLTSLQSITSSSLITFSFYLLFLTIHFTSASYCIHGSEYLNETLRRCVNCTTCVQPTPIMIQPCHVHKDTLCGTLHDSYLHGDNSAAIMWQKSNEHDNHSGGSANLRHHGKHHRKVRTSTTSTSTTTHKPVKVEWTFGADKGLLEQESRIRSEELLRSSEALVGGKVVNAKADSVPFSGVETLVWDWQAVALTMAVFSCILFFVVIAVYSFYQARQWRRLKENFDADVEEISARLSLMAASSSEKGDSLEPSFAPIHDAPYKHNRCVYLDQLFQLRKQGRMGTEARGNVYIEETNATANSIAHNNRA